MILHFNPLTLLFMIFGYIFSLFSSNTIIHYCVHFITLIFFGYFFGVSFSRISKRLRPIITFIPLMTIFYFLFSILFSTDPLLLIIEQVFRSITKIIFLLGGVTLFLDLIPSLRLLDAIRTQFFNLNIKLRFLGDFFQLIELSLRFFPLVAYEVKTLIQIDIMLGFSKPKNKIAKISKVANHLPSLLISCMRKASQLGETMESRGYGQVIPRTIAKPVNFSYKDGVIIISIFVFMLGHLIFAKL